jgi:hypothetical protein
MNDVTVVVRVTSAELKTLPVVALMLMRHFLDGRSLSMSGHVIGGFAASDVNFR